MTSSSWDIQAQMETLPPTTRSGSPFISNPVYRWNGAQREEPVYITDKETEALSG